MVWIKWIKHSKIGVKICKIRKKYIENKKIIGAKSINVEKPEGKRISTGLFGQNVDNPVDTVDNY
jgi:hypothetical protein